jgi:hypothetical protein
MAGDFSFIQMNKGSRRTYIAKRAKKSANTGWILEILISLKHIHMVSLHPTDDC